MSKHSMTLALVVSALALLACDSVYELHPAGQTAGGAGDTESSGDTEGLGATGDPGDTEGLGDTTTEIPTTTESPTTTELPATTTESPATTSELPATTTESPEDDPPELEPPKTWDDCQKALGGGVSGDNCTFPDLCAELPGRSAACLQIPSILVVTENVVEELAPGEPPLDGVTRIEGPCVAQPTGSSTREVMCAPDELLLAPSLDAPVVSVEGPEVCIDLQWDAAARPGRPCVGEHLCVVNYANRLGAQPVAIFCHESRLRFAAVGGP